MSPLRLEAVYERIPQGWDRSAPATVRWGVRASLGGERPSEADRLRDGAEQAALGTESVPLIPARTLSLRGPRVGPREAEDSATDPRLLAYSPAGERIPLFDPSFPQGTGQILDLRA